MEFNIEALDEAKIRTEMYEKEKIDNEENDKLKELSNKNVAEIMNLDMESLENKRVAIGGIQSLGLETIRVSSKKNSILELSVRNLTKAGDEGVVARGLLDLQRELKDLDPSLVDFLKVGILSKFFNPIRRYFAKFQKADSVITDIILSLDKGKETLKNDNTTLEIEQESLRNITKKLKKEIALGALMDESLSQKVEQAKVQNMDEEKIKFISEEMLFPLRQRLMDMQQMMVVNQQGIIAMEVIRRNNCELIRGVDRAKTVTISALRTAVMVAGALYNQKIVLSKIELINRTTNDLIASTSKMLKEQGSKIHIQSMESTISVEVLKNAFKDLMDAMDAISTYKQEALPKLKVTISEFKNLAEKGEEYIRKFELQSKNKQ